MSPAPTHRGRSTTAKCLTAAAAFLLAGSLAACGPAEAGLQRDAARQLQERVLGITQASANNDPAGGLAALDSLEADLASAARTGQVSEERRRSITTAATAVRADLTAAKAAADAAAKAAEDAAAAQRQADADAAQKAATAPVAPSPTDDKGNRGKGKDGD
ncbi:hypothetical protein NFC73_04815 [Pseudarthrobacter sp. RMG13]|uniref:Mucin-associated surface protein n=1 Tax=Pseudarthrobacter humi TaxID=2952523 RepID=A0ABT1LKU1_9MICC|nr:hypothetical protein [Pseudarthrobacter humi]MCP8999062.1 hypothetical protein [Pseudarthrobacter humi]